MNRGITCGRSNGNPAVKLNALSELRWWGFRKCRIQAWTSRSDLTNNLQTAGKKYAKVCILDRERIRARVDAQGNY